jgi:hypothetical protein
MRSRSAAFRLALALASVPRPAAAETSQLAGPRRDSSPAAAETQVPAPAPNKSSDNHGMFDVGAAWFAITYGGTALAGTLLWGLHAGTGSGSTAASDSNRWSPLLVPVVGPLVTLGTVPNMRTGDSVELALLLAACQAGGLALFIAGGVEARKAGSTALRAAPSIAVGPGAGNLRWSF